MTATAGVTHAKIFLSWCHGDRRVVEPLLADLTPALGLLADVAVEWWQDSHLTCGEDLLLGVVDRLDEADYGLLLLSSSYFSRPFILEHELPRFAGPAADRKALPVLLKPLPGFGPEWNLRGVAQQVVFHRHGRSYAEHTGVDRTRFANELATAIRARVVGGNRYRAL
jgi:hypothetical protein